jgi:hypothetical protein
MAKRDKATIWKLVDAKCVQLADSVKAARVPFLLLLLWTFVWGTSLYNHDYGYTRELIKRTESVLADPSFSTSPCSLIAPEKTGRWIARYHPDIVGLANATAITKEQKELCDSAIRTRYLHLIKLHTDGWYLSLPGNVGSVTIMDMNLVGNAALLLLLLWFFYAARRENHAILSFVDIMEEDARRLWFPNQFTLAPQVKLFSSEHYAFAYHAVSQRFVFIFSSRSRPLLATSVGLVCLPALMALWNLWTDLRDISAFSLILEVGWRTAIEAVLFVPVVAVTYLIARTTVLTSVLLNAWSLANEHWSAAWDEDTQDEAPSVSIDRTNQRAYLNTLLT